MENNGYGLADFSAELLKNRRNYKSREAIKQLSQNFVDDLLKILFPHFSSDFFDSAIEVESKIYLLRRSLNNVLISLNGTSKEDSEKFSCQFVDSLPEIHQKLYNDAKEIYEGDPAAESIDEVILAYPGFFAIAVYRIAHVLYNLKIPILPRIISEYAHQITGIDIHPGAKIGTPFFIDHGTGIVIGETTSIGSYVKIYQGVTLGALSIQKELAKKKRHPTIEDDVIIYSNAVILGGDTIIGKGSIIGGNVWLTRSIPPNSVVQHRSEINLKETLSSEELNFII